MRVNFTAEIYILCSENYKTILKENKGSNRLNNILCPWIGKLSVIKRAMISQMLYRFKTISIKEIDKLILKFMWKCQLVRFAENNLEKNKVEQLTFSNLASSVSIDAYSILWNI